MAKKYIKVAGFGPFLFNDATDTGIKTDGTVEADNFVTAGLTTNIRLLGSNANKKVVEINDLTPYIAGGDYINVVNDGDGTVTIDTKNLVEINSIDDTDSPYTASVSAYRSIIVADATGAAITVSLPSVTTWIGQTIVIKKTDTGNNITIEANGTETIDGSASVQLVNQYDSITLISDGVKVLIIGEI